MISKTNISQTDVAAVGVIHGRFQVLHNDHLRYLLAGKSLCRQLIVGITSPDPVRTKKETAAPGRESALANPLTYYERYQLVTTALREHGLLPDEFAVVPFPINFPELYQFYVPLNAMFFLTIYDDWGRKKRDYFKSLGLDVHVLREVALDEKGISASDVRSRMIDGQSWEHLVPSCVASLLKDWDIAGRLKNIAG